jgi:hypothetical protein
MLAGDWAGPGHGYPRVVGFVMASACCDAAGVVAVCSDSRSGLGSRDHAERTGFLSVTRAQPGPGLTRRSVLVHLAPTAVRGGSQVRAAAALFSAA